MEIQSLPIACHGKVPSDREYVHHQVGELAVDGFDRWVRESHRQAFLGRSVSVDGYDRAPAFGVVFPTDVGPGLWGILKPSRDATGRRYPFWVAWSAPKQDRRLNAPVFRAAQAFVDKATRGDVRPTALGERVAQIPISSPLSLVSESRSDARSVSMEAFVRAALPEESALTPRQFLAAWMHVFAGRSGPELSALNYGLQLPLDAGGDVVRDASFWMEAVRHLAAGRPLPMTLFWTMPDGSADESGEDGAGGATQGMLHLFVTPPPRRLYAHLFAPDQDSPFVYTPARTTPAHADDALAALPSRHRLLLDDLDVSPSSFLDALT